jgi:hypothetical protein
MHALPVALIQLLDSSCDSLLALPPLQGLLRIRPRISQPFRNLIQAHAIFFAFGGYAQIQAEIVRHAPNPPAKIVPGKIGARQMLIEPQKNLLDDIFGLIWAQMQPHQMAKNRSVHFGKQFQNQIFHGYRFIQSWQPQRPEAIAACT